MVKMELHVFAETSPTATLPKHPCTPSTSRARYLPLHTSTSSTSFRPSHGSRGPSCPTPAGLPSPAQNCRVLCFHAPVFPR